MSDFLERELLQSFMTNPLAQQIAAFGGAEFENGARIKVITKTILSGDDNQIEHKRLAMTFLKPDGKPGATREWKGELGAPADGYGTPSQSYEYFAHMCREYAKSNNTNVVTLFEETVEDS